MSGGRVQPPTPLPQSHRSSTVLTSSELRAGAGDSFCPLFLTFQTKNRTKVKRTIFIKKNIYMCITLHLFLK